VDGGVKTGKKWWMGNGTWDVMINFMVSDWFIRFYVFFNGISWGVNGISPTNANSLSRNSS